MRGVRSGFFVWRWEVTSTNGAYGGIGIPYIHGRSIVDQGRERYWTSRPSFQCSARFVKLPLSRCKIPG